METSLGILLWRDNSVSRHFKWRAIVYRATLEVTLRLYAIAVNHAVPRPQGSTYQTRFRVQTTGATAS